MTWFGWVLLFALLVQGFMVAQIDGSDRSKGFAVCVYAALAVGVLSVGTGHL